MQQGLLRAERTQWQGYCAVLAGFLANFVRSSQAVGSLNAWGTLSVYVASYYYHQNYHNDPFVNSCFFMVFPATCIIEALFFCISHSAVGVFLYKFTGARTLIAICGVFFCGAFFISPNLQPPFAFAVLYSVGVGVGTGMACYTPVWPCWEFFPNSKGKVTGIIAFGYGLSPVLFGLLFSLLANPTNAQPTIEVSEDRIQYKLFSEEVADNVYGVCMIMGGIYAGIFLLSTLLLFSPNQPVEVNIMASVASAPSKSAHQECPSVRVMLTSLAFWELALCFTTGTAYGIYILNVYKTFGLKHYSNDRMLSTIGSIGALLNGLGRLVFPTLLDYVPFKWLYGVTALIQTLLALTISYVATHYSLPLYGLWVVLSFFLFAGNSPVFAIECARLFGNKYFPHRIGSIGFSLLVNGFIVSSLATVFVNYVVGSVRNSQLQGFEVCFFTMAAISATSLGFTIIQKDHY